MGYRRIRALQEIARQFAGENNIRCIEPLGNGLIHETYLVTLDCGGPPSLFVLQSINTQVFPDPWALMENTQRVTGHLQNKAGQGGNCLRLLPSADGQVTYQDNHSRLWRAYNYIESTETFDFVETVEQAFEAAAAFGGFQRQLSDLPLPPLNEVITDFHNTPKRFEQLDTALSQDSFQRAKNCQGEIDQLKNYQCFAGELLELSASGVVPWRVVHNDTKISNVLFDKQSGKAACVIDLDTVMPGLSLFDFGDLVRTATMPVSEDERDLSKAVMRIDIFEALARGYLSTASAFLNQVEIDYLAASGRTITIEQAARFLTDYLNGDQYFKVKRDEHNLDRCRTQLSLAASIGQQLNTMKKIVVAASGEAGAGQ